MRKSFFVLSMLAAGFGVTPSLADSPKPEKPEAPREPAKPEPGDVLVAKTLTLDLKNLMAFSVSPDGGFFGVSAQKKSEEGGMWFSFYFDVATGKQVGEPLEVDGPGILSDKGKSAAYLNLNPIDGDSITVRELATGKQTSVTPIKTNEHFAFTTNGKLVMTARKSTLGFFQASDGKDAFPAVETPDPITALSAVFLNNTRIATLHGNGVVRVWDLTTGKEADKIDPKSDKKGWNNLSIAEDGIAMVIVNHAPGAIYPDQMLWNLKDKKQFTWEQKSKYDTGKPKFQPMAGGRLYFEGYYATDLKDNSKRNLNMVILTELATGNVTNRLIVPEEKWDSKVGVSKDGKRVLMLKTDKAQEKVFVWDIPEKK